MITAKLYLIDDFQTYTTCNNCKKQISYCKCGSKRSEELKYSMKLVLFDDKKTKVIVTCYKKNMQTYEDKKGNLEIQKRFDYLKTKTIKIKFFIDQYDNKVLLSLEIMN